MNSRADGRRLPAATDAPTVLQVAWFAAPHGGGFIASLVALGERLAQAGWRQVLALPRAARERDWFGELAAGPAAIQLLSTPSAFALAREVAAIAGRERACILHAHFVPSTIPVWLASRWLRARARPCTAVWHLHSPHAVAPSLPRRVRDLVKYGLIARDVHTIVVSEGGLLTMTERGLSAHRAHVITNGVDVSRLERPAVRTRMAVREAFTVAADDRVILLSGWHPRFKGADLAIDAAARVAERRGDVRLVVIGTEALRAYVDARFPGGIPPWLRIAAPTDDFAGYLCAADLFLSASRVEGFPYAIAEAMAAGLPVVASDIRGMEWTRAAPGVVRFPSENVEALTQAIERVLAWSPPERETMTAANRKLVYENHTVGEWASRVFALYEGIAAS
ncbi:MAG: glycosyltransferase family 4 protein [Candidatus Krumholzibacteria bacterium]|nr:glycosyltransferase family 4 protein [Candidatus Krumholzibacteria bacterium]